MTDTLEERTVKHILFRTLLLVVTLFLVACGGQEPEAAEVNLTVSGGEIQQSYTLDDLRALPAATSTAEGTTYVGVSLGALLQDAGFDIEQIIEVTAVATDDFSAAYGPDLFSAADAIVAYETDEGSLAQDEQPLRMVLPEQPGRMNVRMLARIEVTQ